LVDDTGL